MAKAEAFKGVTYGKNPTMDGCCCACSKRNGKLIGLSSSCGHTEAERKDYEQREKGAK